MGDGDALFGGERGLAPGEALSALELDADEGLVAVVPGVVTGVDVVDHARPQDFLGTVVVLEVEVPGDDVADVVDLAAVGLRNRLDIVRPAPAGLKRIAANL